MDKLTVRGKAEMQGMLSKSALLAHVRTVAKHLAQTNHSTQTRADICIDLLSEIGADECHNDFRRVLQALPMDERHYWVGTLYTLMLPNQVRRSQATYFTPPAVADAVVDMAIAAGFDLRNHDVLDPAAGGAAFLSTLAGRMSNAELPPFEVAHRLNGIEIDEGLAALSRHLIAERLGSPLPREVIVAGDALRYPIPASYGLVIANPPYGRISLHDVNGHAWKRVAHRGHINKYALFTELCFRHAKPGGVVALVIPSSFRAGPLYDRMRKFIRSQGEVISIASIAGRDGVFVDVAQDVSILIVRKGRPHPRNAMVSFAIVGSPTTTKVEIVKALPQEAGDAWPLPTADPSGIGGATLADYGIVVRAGYFVWNREKNRLVEKLADHQKGYPLIWAKNVRLNEECTPAGKKNNKVDFVTFDSDSTAIITTAAAVMQRTTNDKQPRRLVVAMVDPAVVQKWGGFVTENHTIVLTADNPDKLRLAITLLNTAAVDQRYRRVSGTAAVSVTLLRQLDLPTPTAFVSALAEANGDAEVAARAAYRQSKLVDA